MKKSIRNLVADKINKLREQIKVWDDPNASSEAKGVVLSQLVGSDVAIWSQIARVAGRKTVTKTVLAPAQPILPAKPAMEKSAPTPGTILPVSSPAPKSAPVAATKFMPAKPALPTGTAPARTLQVAIKEPTLVEKRDRFINLLRQFVQDNGRIDGAKVRGNLAGMLDSGVELEPKHFEVVFAAARKAGEIGFYILDRKTSSVFYRAPAETVDAHVFGQDGELVQVLAEMSEAGEKVSNKTVARTHILIDALDALKKAGRLGEFEIGRVEALLAATRRANHQRLIEEVEEILSVSHEEQMNQIHEQAKVENRPFAGLKEMLAS